MSSPPMGPNRYGKSGIRLAVVDRSRPTHAFTDLEVEVRLHGDFDAAHVDGDNSAVLPTDTMRGTCFALARDGIDSVVGYGVRLVDRFLDASPGVDRAVVTLTQYPWQAVTVDGEAHEHTFRPAAGGRPTWTVSRARNASPTVTGGILGARVLKTTGSAFSGFLCDEYTTLPETRDRVMATTVDARWGTTGPDADHSGMATDVPATILAAFASHDASESVQHTLHVMGTAVLDAHPDITWIRFLLPNEHHILSDLSPYGLDNPGLVYLVADRPFGVIEGAVARDGVTPEVPWDG
ncbi:factor-independent urate hydroxylase [Euzebya rosea]|uniref:factor-independent urate hydroxylase n=1 Tax=Euzebya rosea TaxID=2052804 RepID=UPI000D3EA402|nr:urate oxidase [Euzebya rosea]